jgi:hypothetical protein
MMSSLLRSDKHPGPLTVFYPKGNGGFFPGVRRPGSESIAIKNDGAVSSLPRVFMAWCTIN